MKNYQNHLPSILLLAYAIYSALVPTSIAHSLIILSLAALCGFQIHISRQETLKFNEKVLDSLKNELAGQISEQKEFYAKKISKLEDEMAKMSLNTLPPKTVSSSPQPRKMVF